MNKKRSIFIILGVVMLILTVTGALAGKILLPKEDFTDIGDQKEEDVNRNSSSLVYKEVVDKQLIKFETYLNKTVIQDSEWNKTGNETDTRGKFYETYVELSNTSEKIYSISTPKGIKYSSDTYTFNESNGWVCGDYIVYLDLKDGGGGVSNRAEEFKCDGLNQPVIRSGESGCTINLKTKEKVCYSEGVKNVQI